MTAIQRITSTALVLAMLMAVTVVPAFAAAVGSASITSGDLLSGESKSVVVKITNNGISGTGLPGPLGGGTGDPINAISIEVPTSIYNVSTVTLPAGWSGEYDADVAMVYATAPADKALARGASMDVTLNGAAKVIADDSSRAVPVFVSGDGGMTLTSAGTPSLTSRILGISSALVAKPGTAVNQSGTEVTEGQTSSTVNVSVRNFGSAARSVTFAARKAGGSSTATVDSAETTIQPGATVGQVLTTTFGAPGGLTLEAIANSASSAAKPLQLAPITVQTKFAGSYVANSLNPRTVVQGQSNNFELKVDKTGVQPADLTTVFSILGTTVAATKVTNFPANSNQTTLTFNNVTVPAATPNGDYDTKLTATGVDYNGAGVNVTLTPNKITLDNILPAVTINANVGPSAVNGTTPAAGDGRSITFSGNVTVGGAACGTCTIAAELVPDVGAPIPFTLTNTNGTLSASRSFTFPAGTTSAKAVAVATKTTGLQSPPANSNTFEVDLIRPALTSATTGRDDTGDYVNVTVSEFVDATNTNALDWSVDGNQVTSVQPQPATNGATTIQLRLGQTLDSNATPSVAYQVPQLIGRRMNDRVALTIADKVLEAIDGIVPEAPVITTVQGLATQGGEFWTRLTTPTVSLTGLDLNNLLVLYYDTNDNGTPENSERVFEGPVTAASQTVTLTGSLGVADTQHDLLARMHDATSFGKIASEILNVDRTAPVITAFTAAGSQVNVTFSEVLPRGRNAAFDWTVEALQDGDSRFRTVESVNAGATAKERMLNVSGASYDPAKGAVTGVRFNYRGIDDDTNHYNDRATNRLASQTHR